VRPGAKCSGLSFRHRKGRSCRGGTSLASLELTSRLPAFHNAACLRHQHGLSCHGTVSLPPCTAFLECFAITTPIYSALICHSYTLSLFNLALSSHLPCAVHRIRAYLDTINGGRTVKNIAGGLRRTVLVSTQQLPRNLYPTLEYTASTFPRQRYTCASTLRLWQQLTLVSRIRNMGSKLLICVLQALISLELPRHADNSNHCAPFVTFHPRRGYSIRRTFTLHICFSYQSHRDSGLNAKLLCLRSIPSC
jgi:hypothetical protein